MPETPNTAAEKSPSPEQSRLHQVDALRGFALLGILVVNIWAFADPYYATGAPNPAYDSALDRVALFFVSLVFEAKFYLLFSFLFGYSFTLQMAAAERAGASFLPRMLRRQTGLLLFGLLHGGLLYFGEILSLYAILGVILLACRGLAPNRALKIGVALIVLAGAMWMLVGVAGITWGMLPEPAGSSADAKLAAFRGDMRATLDYHLNQFPATFSALLVLQAPSAMAMFLLGFAAGRVRLFERLKQHQPAMRGMVRKGLPFGVAGALGYALAEVYVPGSALEVLAFGFGQLTAPLLTAFYVVVGLRLYRTGIGQRVERALVPMGRMALTNYLGQSLVLGLLFTGYGLGLIDRLSPPASLALVPVVFLLQLALSRWWLQGHPYGPGEWLLRAITIAGSPPWRRDRPGDGMSRIG